MSISSLDREAYIIVDTEKIVIPFAPWQRAATRVLDAVTGSAEAVFGFLQPTLPDLTGVSDDEINISLGMRSHNRVSDHRVDEAMRRSYDRTFGSGTGREVKRVDR